MKLHRYTGFVRAAHQVSDNCDVKSTFLIFPAPEVEAIQNSHLENIIYLEISSLRHATISTRVFGPAVLLNQAHGVRHIHRGLQHALHMGEAGGALALEQGRGLQSVDRFLKLDDRLGHIQERSVERSLLLGPYFNRGLDLVFASQLRRRLHAPDKSNELLSTCT